jgi:hypothetical protein
LVKGSTTIDRRGLERVGKLPTNLVAHHPRDADPTGLGQRLQARRDIDPVAKNVVALDNDVVEIDADAKPDAPLVGQLGLAVEHAALHFGRTAHRVDDAGEFRQHAVAGGLDDAAVMLADLRIDHFGEMRLEALMRAFLVRPHQPRIARHIGGEDRGETAGRGHYSSGIPALRRPAKNVASYRSRIFGTPQFPTAFKWAMLE